MKPSERIQQIGKAAGAFENWGRIEPTVEHVIAYLDEQEQSSHAAKGDHSFPCGPCGGTGNLPGHYDAERNWHQGIKCQTCKGSGRLNEGAKAEQHGGGRAAKCPTCAAENRPDGECTACQTARMQAELRASKSPAPDADGGEEDGARRMYRHAVTEALVCDAPVWSSAPQEMWLAAFRFARDLGRQDSAEALGRAEKERDKAEAVLLAWFARNERGTHEALTPLVKAAEAILSRIEKETFGR